MMTVRRANGLRPLVCRRYIYIFPIGICTALVWIPVFFSQALHAHCEGMGEGDQKRGAP